MSKRSAGILPYRRHGSAWQVLLVHPGGPFWANKDAGAWSIAKGEYSPPEPALEAAIREFEEETSHRLAGPFTPLGTARLKSGKVIEAWATASDIDSATVRSNTFELEFPKGVVKIYPEVDRAAWFDIETAKQKIHPGQVALITHLIELLVSPDRSLGR